MAELRPSPALGADTRLVLGEWLGLDEAALDRLADDGVV
jgi:crotonobetainyl-CoA:carnitine CoA-transferase CaiB-like acyl-CoA transferase